MKIFISIFKWFFWSIGFPLVLGALVLAFFDHSRDRLIPVFSLLFFGLIMILVGYALKFNKHKSNVIFQPERPSIKRNSELDIHLVDIVTEAQGQWQKEVKNYRYQKEQIRGKILQSLETIEIIESTKNLDTLQSRYLYLIKLFHELQIASTTSRYFRDAQDSIDDYKQLYYDKIPHRTQLAGVLKPLEFDIVAFGGESVFNCFMRHYDFQLQQINSLKTASGKKGRYKKLLDSLDETTILLRDEFIGGIDFEGSHQKLKKIKLEIEQKLT